MPTQSPSETQGDYYAKHYGVRADGPTDDVPSIQAAISACVANGGARVFLPPGTVGCGTMLILPSNLELVIPTNCVFKATASLTTDMIQNADQVNGNPGIRISGGGVIDGNRANLTGAAGNCVSLKKCDDAQIEEVLIQNAYTDGVLIDTCKRTVLDVTALSCGRDGGRLSTATFVGGRLHAANNGQRTAGNGLSLTSTTTDVSMIVLATDTQGSPTQAYGIQELTSNCNRNVFVGSCNGNVTAGSLFLGASSQLFTQPSLSGATLNNPSFTGTATTPSAAGSSGLAGTAFSFVAGAGDGVGVGANVDMHAGQGGASAAGGHFYLWGGNGLSGQPGGDVQLIGGGGNNTGQGGVLLVHSRSGAGLGGSINATGGDAGAGTNQNGGKINLSVGAKDGSGLKPLVEIDASGNIPTNASMSQFNVVGFRYVSGGLLTVFVNDAGTIKHLDLGTPGP